MKKYLVDTSDTLAALGTGILEGMATDLLGGVLRDQLDRLDDAVNDLVQSLTTASDMATEIVASTSPPGRNTSTTTIWSDKGSFKV